MIIGKFESPHSSYDVVKIVRSLGFFNIETGPWVAGGAVRRMFTDGIIHVSDIDIFYKNEEDFEKISKMIESRDDYKSNSTNFAYKTFILKNENVYILQLIKKPFLSVNELLNDFDFTICMAATDGWNWITDDRFFNHLEKKILFLNNFTPERRSKISISKRIAKYCSYGFTPIPNLVTTMCGFRGDVFLENLTSEGVFKSNDETKY